MCGGFLDDLKEKLFFFFAAFFFLKSHEIISLSHCLLSLLKDCQSSCAAEFSMSNASHHSIGSKFQTWRRSQVKLQ